MSQVWHKRAFTVDNSQNFFKELEINLHCLNNKLFNNNNNNVKPTFENLNVNIKPIIFEADSGFGQLVISEKLYRKMICFYKILLESLLNQKDI